MQPTSLQVLLYYSDVASIVTHPPFPLCCRAPEGEVRGEATKVFALSTLLLQFVSGLLLDDFLQVSNTPLQEGKLFSWAKKIICDS